MDPVNPETLPIVVRDLVGFAKWDGDEYHGFIYYSPGDNLDAMARDGYYEVVVERTEPRDDG